MINIPDSLLPQNSDGDKICPSCSKIFKECICPTFDSIKPKCDTYTIRVRLDKKSRRGKLVTVVEDLPLDETYIKKLTKMCKVKTGSGGTFYKDSITLTMEIQGDHQDIVCVLLKKEGFILK
jgi:translation initiation factor 1 (eIF-1/SUI1)